MSDDKHAGNILLLRTACITLILGLVLAWCLVGTNVMRLSAAIDLFKNPEALLSAHLDFLMMTMLLLGFYASKITLPALVQWPMAIGSITNPSAFLVGALGLSGNPVMSTVLMLSLILTTFGYGMAAIKVLRSTLK